MEKYLKVTLAANLSYEKYMGQLPKEVTEAGTITTFVRHLDRVGWVRYEPNAGK